MYSPKPTRYQVPHLVPLIGSLLLLIGGYALLVMVFSRDQAAYHERIQRASSYNALASENRFQAMQQRRGVEKEIWYTKNGHRLPIGLSGRESELSFIYKGENEICERMQGVRCSVQEAFFIPSEEGRESHLQRISVIDADSATYDYAQNTLDADRVFIEEFLLEDPSSSETLSCGKITCGKAMIKLSESEAALNEGVVCSFREGGELQADKANIDLGKGTAAFLGKEQDSTTVYRDGEGMTVQARKIEVSFSRNQEASNKGAESIKALGDVVVAQGEKWKIDSDYATYQREGRTATFWGEGDRQVVLQDDRGKIFAGHAKTELLLQRSVLEDNVKLIHREGPLMQCALADRVIVSQETEEMHFQASPGKRVLFFDKMNQLQMSAPALKIKRDPVTKKEAIQGIGDVRFHLLEKEYERLRKHIPKYTERDSKFGALRVPNFESRSV